MKKILLILTLCLSFYAHSYNVIQTPIKSPAMNKSFQSTIVFPNSYRKNDLYYPVIYVLHGWSGDYTDYMKNARIGKLADKYQVILVMPDGDFDKWYIDSPFLANSKFETYIGKEVVSFVDQNFRTIHNRNGRAITGLSMGGFGALNITLNNLNKFGAVGSMSGGVDPRKFYQNWGLQKVFGNIKSDAEYWDSKVIINNAYRFVNSNTAIIIDCGKRDFFIETNRELHRQLIELGIPHEYIEKPGQHDWHYWNKAVRKQIKFLSKALNKAQPSQ